ncbi:MAG: TIGR02301 family protein [Hyphomonadaceae bacterium]|nr:TIGR02301 family protein [Hyphomonadaceae bacterium]
MPIRSLAMAIALAGLAWPGPAAAQRVASYDEQLSELGRVLGGAHYLRILCTGRTDQRWRDFMREVMSREQARSSLLSAAFNEGFRREESRFSVCGRDSQQMEAELRAQGLRLAGALAARNSGGAPAEGAEDED